MDIMTKLSCSGNFQKQTPAIIFGDTNLQPAIPQFPKSETLEIFILN